MSYERVLNDGLRLNIYVFKCPGRRKNIVSFLRAKDINNRRMIFIGNTL